MGRSPPPFLPCLTLMDPETLRLRQEPHLLLSPGCAWLHRNLSVCGQNPTSLALLTAPAGTGNLSSLCTEPLHQKLPGLPLWTGTSQTVARTTPPSLPCVPRTGPATWQSASRTTLPEAVLRASYQTRTLSVGSHNLTPLGCPECMRRDQEPVILRQDPIP